MVPNIGPSGPIYSLRGSGPDVLWPDAVALLIIGTAVFVLASLRFRKSLD